MKKLGYWMEVPKFKHELKTLRQQINSSKDWAIESLRMLDNPTWEWKGLNQTVLSAHVIPSWKDEVGPTDVMGITGSWKVSGVSPDLDPLWTLWKNLHGKSRASLIELRNMLVPRGWNMKPNVHSPTMCHVLSVDDERFVPYLDRINSVYPDKLNYKFLKTSPAGWWVALNYWGNPFQIIKGSQPEEPEIAPREPDL